MTHRKKLIEVALPLEAINAASAREKSIRHGHPSTLHLWWARRPLAAARAVIFTSLVDDPDDPDALPAFVEACKKLPIGANVKANGDTPRMRLFDFIERLVTWEATTDEQILNQARALIQIATEGNPPPLLDPFAGGGSIPLEAQRLGLEAHASDLNPVAVMINKAQIEIPPRFANLPPVNPRDNKPDTGGDAEWHGAAGLAADVRYYGEWMRERAWERIGHLYPKHNGETVIAWIWARTVKSPNPAVNAHVPIMRSFVVSRKKGNTCWAKPIVNGEKIRFEITLGSPPKGVDGTLSRGGGKCLLSGVPIPLDYLREEGLAGRLGYQLVAIVTEGIKGRSYYSPDANQEEVALSAEPDWAPRIPLVENPRHMSPPLYGMKDHADLYMDRQLTSLSTFSALVSEARDQVLRDHTKPDDGIPLHMGGSNATAYADAISLYLSFSVGRLANRSATLGVWNTSGEKIEQVFARQLLPMTWDYPESNPFSNSSGNWAGNLDWIAKVIENLPQSVVVGSAIQHNAMEPQPVKSQMAVSTDPPYYDNVPYADLADFFYVWLRRSAEGIYPDIFGTMLAPKETELVADPHRQGGRDEANQYFEDGFRQTFANIRKFATEEIPLSIYYAFKQTDIAIATDGEREYSSTGWEAMLEGVVSAGFYIDGTWPIRTERSGRMRNTGSNALASSIVLVCRPRPEDAASTSRRAFVDALRRELPPALKEMQSGNIAPVDLAQASIGPGMAIYSRYSQVLEADGTPMSVRTALGLINQELDAYLSEQEGDVDSDTRFAISWFEQFGFDEGEFGQADVLARAKNTSVAGVEAAGLVESGRGKVRLTHWSEYDPGMWNPDEDKRTTVWEATHHLIERLNSHGETGAAMLINKMPSDMAAEARQLAYRLYSICERKSWADHARDYNALVISWSGIGEEGARLREAAESGQATQQPRLFGDE